MDEGRDPRTDTGTLAAARDHARSLVGTAAAEGPTVPAAAAVGIPAAASGAPILWAERIPAGGYTSRRLPRGTVLEIGDPGGDACVQLLVHNAAQTSERLNVADTVKVQWQAYLARGSILLSDMGRVLMTIVDDTSERHDCLCGCSVRSTDGTGTRAVSGPTPNGRDLLALGLAKFGLSRRDVAPNVNLFKSVRADESGALTLDGEPRAGTFVRLRAEMDVIVALANARHPLDDRTDMPPTGVTCHAWTPTVPVEAPDHDGHRASTPERERAYQNTDDYLLGAQQ